MTGHGRPSVILDRDGVLNELVPDPQTGLGESPLTVDAVRLARGAAAAVRRLRAEGYAVACASNQPAAAKGRISLAEVDRIHGRVLELLAAEGATLDAWRLCLHHPAGVVAALSGDCDCRKPMPGMLLDIARELNLDLAQGWMVGDTDTDLQAGAAAGCRTICVLNPSSAHKRSSGLRADTAADLEEAVALLLAADRR